MLFKNWLEEISLNRGFIGLQPKWFFQKWDSRAQMFTHAFVLAEGELIWSLNQIKKKQCCCSTKIITEYHSVENIHLSSTTMNKLEDVVLKYLLVCDGEKLHCKCILSFLIFFSFVQCSFIFSDFLTIV